LKFQWATSPVVVGAPVGPTVTVPPNAVSASGASTALK
jgi:hypothetical protein